MIPYKGTRAGNLRQYIASKPDKWGFKFFVCASSDGIVHDLFPYQGRATFDNNYIQLNEKEEQMNLSSKIVISLAKTMTRHERSIIYADNFFTSFNLVKHLKVDYGCLYTGTARETRMGNPGLSDNAALNKKSVDRGTSCFKSRDGIIAIKWKDTKVVCLISSATGFEPETTISRYDKNSKSYKDVSCPNIIKEYNKNIGQN